MTEDTYRGEANDPLSLNLYTYCHNEPIMYTDPTGHLDQWDEDRYWGDNDHDGRIDGSPGNSGSAPSNPNNSDDSGYYDPNSSDYMNPVARPGGDSGIGGGNRDNRDRDRDKDHSPISSIIKELREYWRSIGDNELVNKANQILEEIEKKKLVIYQKPTDGIRVASAGNIKINLSGGSDSENVIDFEEYNYRHLKVQIAVAIKVLGTIEEPIKGAGRMDIYNPLDNLVWEVKPDNSNWNEYSGRGAKQLQKYIDASYTSENQEKFGGPISAGYQIETFTIPYGDDQIIVIRSGNGRLGTTEAGMIYYSVKEKQTQPSEATEKTPVRNPIPYMIPALNPDALLTPKTVPNIIPIFIMPQKIIDDIMNMWQENMS